MSKMKPEIKKKWIKALKSKKYKQAKGKLRSKKGDSYCCLGVLCDLYAKEENVKWTKYYDGDREFLGSEMYLPLDVMKWAGLDSCDPHISDLASLSSLNDGDPLENIKRHNFKEIAKVIEEKL